MGTIRGGRKICDACGRDCTDLYGFAMTTDRIAARTNENVKKALAEVNEIYGRSDFVICWPCTAKMMGIPTLEAMEAKEAAIKEKESEKPIIEDKPKGNADGVQKGQKGQGDQK